MSILKKSFVHAVFTLLIVTHSGCAELAKPAPRNSKDDYKTQSHDFGVVGLGDKLEHVFTIKNTSKRDWHLLSAKTTCGCLVAVPEGKCVPCGGSMDVEVKYTAPSKPFNDKRAVVVVFEEPDAPLVNLQITSSVRDAISAFPDSLSFSVDPCVTSKIRHVVTVENHTGSKWTSVSAKALSDEIGVGVTGIETREISKQGEAWDIQVELDFSALEADVSTALELEGSGGSGSWKCAVPLSIRRKKWLVLAPSSLYAGEIATGKYVNCEVQLILSDDALEQQVSQSGVEIDIECVGNGVSCSDTVVMRSIASKVSIIVNAANCNEGVHRGQLVFTLRNSLGGANRKAMLPYVFTVVGDK